MSEDDDLWSYSAGEYGNTVTVFERTGDGNLYVRVPNESYSGGYRVQSLGHKNRTKAKALANRTAAKLIEGAEALDAGRPNLSLLFRLYRREKSPQKTEKHQTDDERAAELWKRELGATTTPDEINDADLDRFQARRKAGEIDGRGREVDDYDGVSHATARRDIKWLNRVFRWAVRHTHDGEPLLDSNPIRGYEIERAKNVTRPVATRDRYEAIREVAGDQRMRMYRDGTAWYERSYLRELLDLAVFTGRRIGAMIALRYSDLDLEETDERPHGGINWPGETDKEGKQWTSALHPKARDAIDRQLNRVNVIGRAYLFPAPTDPEGHVATRTVERWLKKAEDAAEVEHMEGGLWHPYRRMWASERRHLPDVDVAQAGGWSDPEVMRESYQHADESGTYHAVTGERERRETGEN